MFGLMPRDTVFFDLFEQAAAVNLRAAEAYAGMAQEYERRQELISRIRELEHDGDDIAHRTLQKLDTSFITPFDREDIHALMMQLDDVLDEIDAASKRFTLYQIKEPTPWFIKQTDVLLKASQLVVETMPCLRNLKRTEHLQQKLVRIHELENAGDENNHAAVAELFNTGQDPIYVLKWKEIYDLTERAIDGCEDIANIIAGIVLKNG